MDIGAAVNLAVVWWIAGIAILTRAVEDNDTLADATVRRSFWRWSWMCFIWPLPLWKYRRREAGGE